MIATAETWRIQVFGSKGWAEGGEAEHLTTWELRTCFIDQTNLFKPNKAQTTRFETLSTERADLEHFARAAAEKRPLAVPGGDEQHGVSVFEAILASAKQGRGAAVG